MFQDPAQIRRRPLELTRSLEGGVTFLGVSPLNLRALWSIHSQVQDRHGIYSCILTQKMGKNVNICVLCILKMIILMILLELSCRLYSRGIQTPT